MSYNYLGASLDICETIISILSYYTTIMMNESVFLVIIESLTFFRKLHGNIFCMPLIILQQSKTPWFVCLSKNSFVCNNYSGVYSVFVCYPYFFHPPQWCLNIPHNPYNSNIKTLTPGWYGALWLTCGNPCFPYLTHILYMSVQTW